MASDTHSSSRGGIMSAFPSSMVGPSLATRPVSESVAYIQTASLVVTSGAASSTAAPSASNARAAAAVASRTSGSTGWSSIAGLHAIRSPPSERSASASSYDGGTERMDVGSRGSGPASTDSSTAASRTLEASGPPCESGRQAPGGRSRGTRPYVGLMP